MLQQIYIIYRNTKIDIPIFDFGRDSCRTEEAWPPLV